MRKEVILVNLPPGKDHRYDNAGSIYPATGIMIIGTILKKRGINVRLIDGAVDPFYEKTVLGNVSDETVFVGFSTMTSQLMMAYKLAKKIKEKRKNLPIVFGGIHPTLFPEGTVDTPYIDIAVVNEGAKTVLDIMEHIDGNMPLDEIKGIAFKGHDGRVKITLPRDLDDISEIPHFDFELLDMEKYLNASSVYKRELDFSGDKKVRLMPILTGLGCCFRCAFCINVILKRRYRLRPAASIIQEIKRLQSEYGANAFLFLDEDFCINKNRLAEFIDLVKKEDLKFAGRIWARVSFFRMDSFKKMVPELERTGIKSIAMGAESASQRMLDYIQKDIRSEDIMIAAEELAKVKITPRFSFIAGMEGERKEETIATYKMCAELLRLNPRTDIAGPFTFRYYPGSPIFKAMVEKYNIALPDSIDEWDRALNNDGSLIVDMQKWTWPGFVEYSESMRNYINLYTLILNSPRWRNGFFCKVIRRMILWRISCGEYFYKLDYYFTQFAKRIRKFFITLKSRVRTLGHNK
ncbi:MAG: radical SAM protein [Candidatus Omnitrophota bacterium]